MARGRSRVVAEMIAAVGVIFSLVFVGYEVRQNTVAARAQAYQEIGLAVSDAWGDMARDGELMEIFWRANGQDPDVAATVTGIDRERARFFMMRALRLWETVFLNIQIGTLGEEAMDQMGNWRRTCEWPLLERDWEYFQYYLGAHFGPYVADTCGLEWTGPRRDPI